MRKAKTNLEIPEDAYLALATIGYTKKRISLEAKSLLAAHLFERGVFFSLTSHLMADPGSLPCQCCSKKRMSKCQERLRISFT